MIYGVENIKEKIRQIAEELDLDKFLNTKVGLLSSGEQTRVALAKALINQPKLLLLDEPTASLDPEMVGEVLSVIKDLVNEGMTTVISTHEMGFAREAADRVVVFADGEIIDTGPPDEIFSNPKNERTKSFLSRILR